MTPAPSRSEADITRLLNLGLPEGRVVRIGQYEGAWTVADVARVVAARRPEPDSEPAPKPDCWRSVRRWQPPTLVGAPRRVVLTMGQAEALDGICRGLSNAEIGGELGTSEDTVKTQLRKAYVRLGARDRAHAAALACSGRVEIVVENRGGRRPGAPR